MDLNSKALEYHDKLKGKLEVSIKGKLESMEELALAYTPGVAEPCKEIAANKEKAFDYTWKGNTIAIVSDGSRVLGLGNIGPEAALPVMEGKAALFKKFGNVNAIPICINSKGINDFVATVKALEPSFGGINLEDIESPKCFEVEEILKKEITIPVFHDDQHGTAVATLAGLYNALKLVGKNKGANIVVAGAGAAGLAISNLLLEAGFENLLVVDSKAILSKKSDSIETMNKFKKHVAQKTNKENLVGGLKAALEGADVVIGVAKANLLSRELIKPMNKDAIVFALSNPTPEIMPEAAKEAGARIVATGRSDFPNQINNALVFPGIFKGALECKTRQITEEMKLAAAKAIASLVSEAELKEDFIVPSIFDKRVAEKVAEAVRNANLNSQV